MGRAAMGAFYWNIVLKGPSQGDIADALAEMSVEAWISPTIDGITAVYDAISDGYTGIILGRLSSQLSMRFGCSALAAGVWDSDVLCYQLYKDGERDDYYQSDRPESDGSSPPSGGDADKLCAAFGVMNARDEVNAILRYWWHDSVDRTYAVAGRVYQGWAR